MFLRAFVFVPAPAPGPNANPGTPERSSHNSQHRQLMMRRRLRLAVLVSSALADALSVRNPLALPRLLWSLGGHVVAARVAHESAAGD